MLLTPDCIWSAINVLLLVLSLYLINRLYPIRWSIKSSSNPVYIDECAHVNVMIWFRYAYVMVCKWFWVWMMKTSDSMNKSEKERQQRGQIYASEILIQSFFSSWKQCLCFFFRRQANSNSVRAQAQIVCLRSDIYLICIRPDSCLFRSSLFFLSISPIEYYECVHTVHIQFVSFLLLF